MKVNREGYATITVSLLFFVATILFIYILHPNNELLVSTTGGLLLVVWLFIISFFREPKRELVQDNSLVYAPCDGVVVVREQVEQSEYQQQRMVQVSIFMSVTNVHINWVPVSGVIEYFKHHRGEYLVAWHPKSSTRNEHTTTVVRMESGRMVMFRQIAGYVARRIVSYVNVGERVEQNSHAGFIKFGSRVDILLPMDCEILVDIGDRVVGGQTPIGSFSDLN